MLDDIKTIEVQTYAMRFDPEDHKSDAVRAAAEKLAEAILDNKYPMIPNKTYLHKWSDAGLISKVNCPSIIQYVEPFTDWNDV